MRYADLRAFMAALASADLLKRVVEPVCLVHEMTEILSPRATLWRP